MAFTAVSVPFKQYEPATQSPSGPLSPVVLQVLPPSHGRQLPGLVARVSGLKRPAAQGTALVMPYPSQNEPAGHSVQSSSEVPPVAALNLPGGQACCVLEAEKAGHQNPAEHVVGAVAA